MKTTNNTSDKAAQLIANFLGGIIHYSPPILLWVILVSIIIMIF